MLITIHYGSHKDKAPRQMDFNIELDESEEIEENTDVKAG